MAIGKGTFWWKSIPEVVLIGFFSCAKASETKKEGDNFIAFYIVWRLILLRFHESDGKQ